VQRQSQVAPTGKKKTAWGKIFGAPGSNLDGSDSTSTPSAFTPAISIVS